MAMLMISNPHLNALNLVFGYIFIKSIKIYKHSKRVDTFIEHYIKIKKSFFISEVSLKVSRIPFWVA